MYGSLSDDDNAAAAAGPGDSLLPPREPSTAANRRLRQRRNTTASSSSSKRHLMTAKQNLNRHQQQQQQQIPDVGKQPVMKALFPSKSKRKLHRASVMAAAAGDPEVEMESLLSANKKNDSQIKQRRKSQAKRASQSVKPETSYQTQKPEEGDDEEAQQEASSHSERKDNSSHRNNHHVHTYLFLVLHPHSRHPHALWFQQFISTVIMMDVCFFVASTDMAWKQGWLKVFTVEEGLVSSLFLLEYFCRLWIAPQHHKYANMTLTQARWQYAKTWPAVIDLVSALPFFLELPFDLDLPTLTWIRIFRLVRILKTESYLRSIDTVWRVLYYNREILYVAFYMCILLVLLTAILMYYLKPQDPADAEEFSSLLATMYLSAMMLTGQGQPEGDLPWYTKSVVLLTGFFSVAMFAIPASMLTWGFEAEAERCARRARQKYVAAMQHADNEDDDGNKDDEDYNKYISETSSSEGSTTDEEYLNIIAGGSDDEGDDGDKGPSKEDEVVQQLIRTFQTSDTDASGSLSMDEFIQLMTDPSVSSQQLTLVGMATSIGLLVQRVQHLENQLSQNQDKLDQILKAVKK